MRLNCNNIIFIKRLSNLHTVSQLFMQLLIFTHQLSRDKQLD